MDKTPARTTKRNAGDEAPASKAAPVSDNRGSRRGGLTGNEGGSYFLAFDFIFMLTVILNSFP